MAARASLICLSYGRQARERNGTRSCSPNRVMDQASIAVPAEGERRPRFDRGKQPIARHESQPRCAIARASSENDRLVLISVAPHCTQVWVMSSRSFESAPLAYRAGATAVMTHRCPQCGQGSRTLGRCEGTTLLQCMELFGSEPSRRLGPLQASHGGSHIGDSRSFN